MAKGKTDHKSMASDMVKNLINQPSTTPLQTNENNVIKPVEAKITVDKMTVDIESSLLHDVRIYAAQNKLKLRPVFEKALAEYLENHGYMREKKSQ